MPRRLAGFLFAVLAQAQWSPQRSGTTVALRGVSAVSETVAWASGQKGSLLRTVDGGKKWLAATVPGAEALDFRDVHAVDARTAYLLSSGPGRLSRIYKTTDGGASWTLQLENTQEKGFFDALAFWDRERGLVVGDPVDGSFVVMMTSDGGASWQAVARDRLPPARAGEGAFAASGTCLIVGRGGRAWFGTGGTGGARVFRSENWGRTWHAAATPLRHDAASSGIFSLSFRDGRHGVALGGDYTKPSEDRDNVAVSSDGGQSWVVARGTHPAGYRSAVVFLPGRREALATGPTGTDISADGGHTWVRVSEQGYHAMSFADAGAGWAVGAEGRVARYHQK